MELPGCSFWLQHHLVSFGPVLPLVLQYLYLPAWIEADVWTLERKMLEFLLWLFLQVTLTTRSLLKDSGVTSTSTLRRK